MLVKKIRQAAIFASRVCRGYLPVKEEMLFIYCWNNGVELAKTWLMANVYYKMNGRC